MENFYPIYMYTPMPEMHNVMVPVTSGCSYQKCLYCDLNFRQKFHVFKLAEIEDYLRKEKIKYDNMRRSPKKFTLLEGNPLCVKASFLENVFATIHKYFEVDYISMFARATDVLRKTDEELLRLKAMGMDRLCLGLESGSDEVLSFHKKGHSVTDSIRACKKLERLGISYSVYIMLGLGGKEMTLAHREGTAKLLNEINPFEIVFVTTVIFKRAPLKDLVRAKEFTRLAIKDVLAEEIYILESLENSTVIKATHKTNPLPLLAKFPEGKEDMLRKLTEYRDGNTEKELRRNEMKKWQVWDKE